MAFGFIKYNCDCLVYSVVFELPDVAPVTSSPEHPTAFNRANLRPFHVRGEKDLFQFLQMGHRGPEKQWDLSKITQKLCDSSRPLYYELG